MLHSAGPMLLLLPFSAWSTGGLDRVAPFFPQAEIGGLIARVQEMAALLDAEEKVRARHSTWYGTWYGQWYGTWLGERYVTWHGEWYGTWHGT